MVSLSTTTCRLRKILRTRYAKAKEAPAFGDKKVTRSPPQGTRGSPLRAPDASPSHKPVPNHPAQSITRTKSRRDPCAGPPRHNSSNPSTLLSRVHTRLDALLFTGPGTHRGQATTGGSVRRVPAVKVRLHHHLEVLVRVSVAHPVQYPGDPNSPQQRGLDAGKILKECI